MTLLKRSALMMVVLALLAPAPASAQAGQAAAPPDDPDLDFSFAQPDFTVITLPTTLRLPRFKSAFRVTHRFGRPLGEGDFGDLLSDFFGLDSGANIGLEFRFGLARGWQVGVHRTNLNKTIEFFTQYNLMQQREGRPFGIGAVASIEGTNNFHDTEDEQIEASYSPALGVVFSRDLGRAGALYFQPIWVNNTNQLPSDLADDNDTIIFGLGARIHLGSGVYVTGEVAPRTGYDPGVIHGAFAIEKRVGGHTFQLNFSDGFGTTMAQIARGGTSSDDWYLGFNISRKFF